MGRVDELVTGDMNVIASKEIRQFFVADLKEAKKQLEAEGRTNTIRYECISKEHGCGMGRLLKALERSL